MYNNSCASNSAKLEALPRVDFAGADGYFNAGGVMRKKRLADWLEKISAGFFIGSFLAGQGFWIPMLFSLIFIAAALKLTDRS